jgi:hypothetical protein
VNDFAAARFFSKAAMSGCPTAALKAPTTSRNDFEEVTVNLCTLISRIAIFIPACDRGMSRLFAEPS